MSPQLLQTCRRVCNMFKQAVFAGFVNHRLTSGANSLFRPLLHSRLASGHQFTAYVHPLNELNYDYVYQMHFSGTILEKLRTQVDGKRAQGESRGRSAGRSRRLCTTDHRKLTKRKHALFFRLT